MSFTFYLGAPSPIWLERSQVSLFVSDVRLRDRKSFPRALAPWGLDSGGFSELSNFGRWTIEPREYVERVRRYASEIGNLTFAAPQDWMCEPEIIQGNKAKKIPGTGLSVKEHIRRTVENFFELKNLAPELPFIPVLQGWSEGDYLDCMEAYEKKGLILKDQPLIGVGSVCRRQNTMSASVWISSWVQCYGLKIHGFGFKVQGLDFLAPFLQSADSMAWSFQARRMKQNGDQEADQNSLEFALEWRRGLLESLEIPSQQTASKEATTQEQLKLF